MKTVFKIIFSLIFLIIFFVTRLNGLNNVIGIDNYSWLYRINLYPWVVIENLKGNTIPDKDLAYAGTISYHPGVTIMIFSGLSTKVGKKLIHNYDPLYEDCPYLDSKCKYLDFELFIAKLPLLIIGSLLLLLSINIIYEMWGKLGAIIFSIVLLFEPFLVSTSKDLHLDFIFTSFAITSVLYLIYYFSKNQTKYLYISAILMGFAFLTRSTAVFFLPAILLGFLEFTTKPLKKAFLFGLITLITVIVVYPPMWVAPIQTFLYIFGQSVESVGVPSYNFIEQPFYLRYWSILTWYLHSIPQIYSVAAILLMIFGIFFSVVYYKRSKYPLLINIIFILYLLFICIPHKRYIRYLVPTAVALSLTGSVSIGQIIKRRDR